MLSEETILGVKAVPVAEVVRHFGKVEVSDAKGNVLCPLHGDNHTKSMHLYEETNSFFCFGCHAGGDAITFVQKLRNVTFWEATKLIAEAFGINVKETKDDADPDTQKALKNETAYSEALEQIVSTQAGRWAEVQKKHPEHYSAIVARYGDPADSQSIVTRWGLVFCDFINLPYGMAWAQVADVKDEYKAALVVSETSKRSAMYGRLLIPIRNTWGKVVAFSGWQVIPDPSGRFPKYLTSRGNRFFKKGEVLFGLDRAMNEMRRTHAVNIVEGYADVMTLQQRGLVNTVALQGTALTDKHLELLRRMDVRTITLFPDMDDAGIKAVVKEVIRLARAGFTVQVQEYGQPGDDPDSFFKTL